MSGPALQPATGNPQRAGVARRVEVRGTVQGVGFRPFVSRLARQLGLDGSVRNAGGQVVIDVAGAAEVVASFLERLTAEAPAPAAVADVAVADLDGAGPVAGSGFHIVETPIRAGDGASAIDGDLRPDLPPCADCVQELFDPRARRYRYPFVSCAACGPRASIVEELPYERAHTTMAAFPMCAACEAEYADPTERRFRAELLACPDCGPSLSWRTDPSAAGVRTGEEALTAAIDLICSGGIVAVKSVGGYQLVCDGTLPQTVARLRARKGRWTKPFAVMVADLEVARSLGELTYPEERLIGSAARPIVLARVGKRRLPIAAGVSAGSSRIGLVLPATPLHHLLLHGVDRPVVVTSGNRTNEPIVVDDEEATERLGEIADGFLTHDLPIRSGYDESVARVVADRPVLLRRSRGHVPSPLRLPVAARQPILAVGAQRAHTFALADRDRVVLSQPLEDLSNAMTLEVFEQGLEHLSRLTGITPRVIAHDPHPGCLSTQYASRWPASQRISVQHHHAQVASCAAEHGVAGRFIGIAYDDGLAMGDDGTLWGGEVLVADLRAYRRVGRFGAAPLPGGEVAVRRPARAVLGYLLAGERLGGAPIDPDLVDAFVQRLPDREVETVRKMLRADVNSPLTTSAGRLFDAAACVLRLREDASYDGEAATMLEAAAHHAEMAEELPWRVVTVDDLRVYDPTPTLAALLAGVEQGLPISALAAAFHTTLASVTAAFCVDAGRETGVRTVCLSGGAFQDGLLTTMVMEALGAEGFEVHVNEAVPANDSGVSYGQAVVAAARIAAG
ncbi:carbamoyltransferase HypF [Actinopolymorpha alba]|uniref:carbamoyltransferase HypF n=1 Tax=Actinopolymorpha alba TaxID=533267 RepID=UPI000382658D|nr:carbamoyltransferase HypF [Actinopolymorpha alba]